MATRMLPHNRVECLNEIRPGKICGAHRAADDPRCHVCGRLTKTRHVPSATREDDWITLPPPPRGDYVLARRLIEEIWH